MKLNAGLHLASCTNVHRGERWAEAFDLLKDHALPVHDRVRPGQPCAIGLHLSNGAARELSDFATFREFRRWLDQNHFYVFSIDGFAYGGFHGARIKEQIYEPDWVSPERLDYTKLLFDLLSQLVPPGVEGSVSTLPGSFKGFHLHADELKEIRNNLWHCVEHAARVSEQTGRKMSLGLEPEPLCHLESSGEVIQFYDRMRVEHPRDARLADYLGVNYNTCHFAVEFEEPQNALPCLQQHGIKISRIRLSSALKARPTVETREALAAFSNDACLRQTVVRRADGHRVIYPDLGDALAGESVEPETATTDAAALCPEWRIHLHVPLHSPPAPMLGNTTDHVLGALDWLAANPDLCSQLELETNAWEVLPPELSGRGVADQLAAECEWALARLAERGLVQGR